MSNFGTYLGSEFLTKELPRREWMIENLLKERDCLLWVGQEKSGKTVLNFQAALCCLTTGHPFLDHFNIPKPRKVTYILLEGDLEESMDRVKRLAKSIDIDPTRFVFMFLPRLMLHQRNGEFGLQNIIAKIQKFDCHDVVVIDPLYRAFSGSLVRDEVTREVCANLDEMKDALNCALIVIHHTHKKKFDIKGNVVREGDDATFGSVWFKAWASQIVLQTYDQQTGLRAFYCTTQRSGEIIKECNLRLVQPDPLYFEIDKTERGVGKELLIIDLLQQNTNTGLSGEEIWTKLGISKGTFYTSIKQPLSQGIIKKLSEERPVKYCLVKKEA